MTFLIAPPKDTVVIRFNPERIILDVTYSRYWHLVEQKLYNGVYDQYYPVCHDDRRRDHGNAYMVDSPHDILFSTIGEINSDELCPICWPYEKFDVG